MCVTKQSMGRVRKGSVTAAMVEYLRDHGGQAKTAEIHEAVERRLGRPIGSSSVRGGLQNERLFERVRRGEFRLKGEG